jgi:phosphoribosylaminoimidazolecarboxamide formyltransferase/IMP cyclohydrolase
VDRYAELLATLENNGCATTLEERQRFAIYAFAVSSHYDSHIFNYFATQNTTEDTQLRISQNGAQTLRYGENPHQKGVFFGDLNAFFDQLHGKELSYNNLLDVDAAINLIRDFGGAEPTFGILKHNNACGFASRPTLKEAYEIALGADPVSAFGGILVANAAIDLDTATLINDLFCEVVIAPAFDDAALELLKSKKNRILLVDKGLALPTQNYRSALNGILVQDKDAKVETKEDLTVQTELAPSEEQIEDLLFANKLVKHTKSNTIVLVKNRQLLASGTGQTSRVDALQQAIHKAKTFNFDLQGAVMASDAFFPFPDCVEIANKEGIKTVIQPGGSIKDELSINYCNEHGMSMVFTGVRHFKH